MRRLLLALLLPLLPPSAPASLGAQESQEPPVDPAFFSAFSYRNVGPYRGGRVTAVAGVPQHPFTFYMGSTGGGVFKTEDAGVAWRNTTDGQLQVGGIGAIAVAPSDPNVVYVGTGSAEPRGNISPGIGMYRSTDAGRTWTYIGLREAGQIGKIQVHPDDPDRLWVAALGSLFRDNAERGVFRSRDGGASWEKVLFVSDSTGVVDIAMDPTNPRILFATAWRAKRLPWTMISGSTEGGLYRSKDGGDTWQRLSAGLPQGLWGKAGVAVSPANPQRVWVLVEAEGEAGGMYRSDNGGDSFRQVSADRGIRSRPWYYMRVTADPRDENTIYVNNVLFYRSLDGGSTYTPIPTVPHPDSHIVWINPDNPDIMIEGDDGGATVTLNGGRTWSTQRNQATAELYRVTVDNQFPYRLYGAQQDNTTISVPSRLPATVASDFEQEFQVGGCESGHIAVDPRGHDIVYAGCFGGTISRYDVRTGDTREVMPWPQNQMAQRVGDLRFRFQWNAPIRISPHDPDVLYHMSNHVHRSLNGGQTWETLSPDLTTDDPEHQEFAGGPITQDGTGVEVYGTIFAFEESPVEPGVLWAGSDDGLIHVSRDNGATWTDVTPSGFPAGATVNTIDPSVHGGGRVHVAAYRYRQGDARPYLYRSDDYGRNWSLLTDGSNGIPPEHFTRVVREDPARRDLLYAGTEFGMYLSFDGGDRWQPFQRNLPVTPVTDIQVHQDDLVLSTQGRSFWILDDLTPLHALGDDVWGRTATLHRPKDAHRVFFSGGLSLGGGVRAQNRPDGALLHYTLTEDVEGPVTLTVTDAAGDTARTFSSEATEGPALGAFAALAELFGLGGGGALLPTARGTHRVAWDLRYPAPSLPEGAVIFGTLSQPVAPPGEYTVTLTVNGESQSQVLHVLPDPRDQVPQADFVAQFDFLEELGAIIQEVAGDTDALRSVRSQVGSISEVAVDAGLSDEDLARVEEAAGGITEKLGAVEEEILQTDNRSFYDPLDNPGKLVSQLAYLYNTVAGGLGVSADARPTDAAVERLQELRGEVGAVEETLDRIFSEDLAAFNNLIRALGLEPVVVDRNRRLIS
ncbi:MAG: glycosyl hydrolase [Gemmatimonadales bacterium]|nr:MAG: glycosyl hydrolase [Gemmatimonadales bacterium]